jgi:hypothetical protein
VGLKEEETGYSFFLKNAKAPISQRKERKMEGNKLWPIHNRCSLGFQSKVKGKKILNSNET